MISEILGAGHRKWAVERACHLPLPGKFRFKGSTRNNSGFGLVISKYYLTAFLIVEGEEGDHWTKQREGNKCIGRGPCFFSVIFFGWTPPSNSTFWKGRLRREKKDSDRSMMVNMLAVVAGESGGGAEIIKSMDLFQYSRYSVTPRNEPKMFHFAH